MIDVMKQALEALEYIEHNYMSLPKPGIRAMSALRQAIEQAERYEQDKTEQGITRSQILGNNVQSMMDSGLTFLQALDTTLRVYDHPEPMRAVPLQQEKQEPDGWITAGAHTVPLRIYPPQRHPLTEEEMELLWITTNRREHFFGQHLDFARAIERKHGIRGGHD